jgi:hypothetical protein
MSDEVQKNILTEIRARHEQDQRWRNGPSMICPHAHDDRGWLLSEIERLRARVEVLEKHLALMIVNNLAGSFESEGLATDRAIADLPDWLEKANGYTRLQLDAAAEIVKMHVEEAKS